MVFILPKELLSIDFLCKGELEYKILKNFRRCDYQEFCLNVDFFFFGGGVVVVVVECTLTDLYSISICIFVTTSIYTKVFN